MSTAPRPARQESDGMSAAGPDAERFLNAGCGLEEAVRRAVIPRLYAHRLTSPPAAAHGRAVDETIASNGVDILSVGAAVERLRRLVLAGRTDDQRALLLHLHGKGLTLRSIIEQIVVPVADEIGRAWADDEMSFAEVTLVTGRLQVAVTDLLSRTVRPQGGTSSLLIASMPGDQHVFGASALSGLLNEEGYGTDTMLSPSAEDLCRMAGARAYAAIGLSCNSDRTAPHLARLIGDLRSASLNRHVAIMVGGWAFKSGSESLHDIGADLIVTDGRSAIEDIRNLLAPAVERSISREAH
ncbi:cobalamin B12-binding domain-containing protein [Fulvimarina endophytica]|nr:cobalamin-dependent protein [Fulvimarina endophytica]